MESSGRATWQYLSILHTHGPLCFLFWFGLVFKLFCHVHICTGTHTCTYTITFFLKFYFYFFYRIKYIYLNTITFTQIIISWILRNRLSVSLCRSGMENMLRQIGNSFSALSQFVWLSSLVFGIMYYISIFL